VILENTPRRAARAVLKAVESANANLINNSKVSIDPKTIRIARIFVTSGTRMRRYVPASRGRALPYEKISSNIFVEVAGEEKVKKAAEEKAEAKKEKK
jgi:large subunit ribosomal protein L22